YNLSDGKQVKGFSDVFFCPLLVNDLAHILLRMLTMDLSGLYHVFSRECLSKYEFGVRIAKHFGLDEGLIVPTAVAEGGLRAQRSPCLTMDSSKLARVLGKDLPDVDEGIERFYRLYGDGYVERIKSLVV
ncbi:MAG: sugar nucleotide-binding protein, partial [candidate division KSB1 bacterium]|nr:sugar nucleotide-binding protein [candidate division KSB1 bacterium]